MKWLCVGDLQMPYHDKRAVELFMKVAKAIKPEAIDIVGDIDDQLEYSTYSDGTTDEFFNQLKANEKANEKEAEVLSKTRADEDRFITVEEARKLLVPRQTNPLPFVKENALAAREFYTEIRKQHKNADIHASLGNHDIRVFRYIDAKAPDYIDQITPNMLWGLDDLGITWRMYHERPHKRFADIYVHHGTTSTDTGLAVKTDIEKLGVSLVRGHDHKGGVVYKSYYMPGRSLVGMGCGHLSDENSYGMRYADNPQWQKGFGLIYVVGEKAHLHFIPIRSTEHGLSCVVDGKLFAT